MLNRWNRVVYHCRRLLPGEEGYLDGTELFEVPTLRRLNVRPVSGEAVLVSSGELTKQQLVARLPARSLDEYRENDRLFVYKAFDYANTYDPAAPGADYRVVSVLRSFYVTEIILERLVTA